MTKDWPRRRGCARSCAPSSSSNRSRSRPSTGCVVGGLAVATFCDIRICTPQSRFGYPWPGRWATRCRRRWWTAASPRSGADHSGDAAHLHPGVRRPGTRRRCGRQCRRPRRPKYGRRPVDRWQVQAARLTIVTTKAQLLARSDSQAAGTGVDERLQRAYGSADFREGVRASVAGERPTFMGA